MSRMHAQRGVLFTFLTFLFIGVVLGLLVFNIELGNRSAFTTIEISVLNAINAKYDDITDDIITLDHPIGIPSIHQRILPFTHEIDQNNASFHQMLPLASGKLALYFDLINAYSIFIQDEDVSHTFDGVDVNISVPKPAAWGGTNERAGFNILPQCVQYQIIDINTIHFESTNSVGCENSFSMASAVSRVDILISLPTTVDDYDTVLCDFNGTPACPRDPFVPGQGPYVSILFLDSNCTNCSLSTNDKNISGHFDPSLLSTIRFSCEAALCTSFPIDVNLDTGIRFSHGGTPAIFAMSVTFNEDIRTFYYQDANYTVTKQGFDTLKSNVVVFPQ